jgi:hypothetical protein
MNFLRNPQSQLLMNLFDGIIFLIIFKVIPDSRPVDPIAAGECMTAAFCHS